MNPPSANNPQFPQSGQFNSADAPPPPQQQPVVNTPPVDVPSSVNPISTPTITPPQPPTYEQGTPTVTASGGNSGGRRIMVILGVLLLLAVLGVGAYFIASNFLFRPQEAQPSPTPIAEEEVTAICLNIKAYDEEWNRLSLSDLSALQSGSVVRFSVSGDTSSGSFDMARFSVNSESLGETTQIKPDTNEFYDEYIIPEGVQSFSVEAQIHHQELDQWI